MSTLPDSVVHLFLALFLGSLGVFVLLPACIGYWRLAHGSLSPARQGFVQLKDIPVMLVALALTNAFCYVLGSGSAHPMAHATLRLLLAVLDLPFLLFSLNTIIVSFLTRKTKHEALAMKTAPSQLPINDTIAVSDPSHIATTENTSLPSTDGVPVGDN